jgi:hypothetical protein
MADNQRAVTTPQPDSGWQSRIYLIGGTVGALLGLLSAFLFVRASQETRGETPPEAPSTNDAVRLGISLLSIVRTITEWGRK